MAAPGAAPNQAQRRLAEEVTRFVHGDLALSQALAATEVAPAPSRRLAREADSLVAAVKPSRHPSLNEKRWFKSSPVCSMCRLRVRCVDPGCMPSGACAWHPLIPTGIQLHGSDMSCELGCQPLMA